MGKDIMYRGLKKKYTREQYVKLTLTKNKNKCYFCLNNVLNYNISFTNKLDVLGLEYLEGQCSKCIHNRVGKKMVYDKDNFKTLYDWEDNVEGANNA